MMTVMAERFNSLSREERALAGYECGRQAAARGLEACMERGVVCLHCQRYALGLELARDPTVSKLGASSAPKVVRRSPNGPTRHQNAKHTPLPTMAIAP